MQRLLLYLQEQDSWKESLRKSCKMNSLKTSLASILTPLKIRPLYERLLKTYQSNQLKAKTCWFENQLKAFHWILIVISWAESIKIVQFKDKQWEMLLEIFKPKELHVLKYETIRLNGKKLMGNKPWTTQQQQILKQVINQKVDANKWNEIARTLFKQSDSQFYRTGKQCRQRWFNHLDPNKKHGNWTQQEDQFIANYILKNGKKWSEIAKMMGKSRTQHMVKNRFKSMIIQQKKYHPKLIHQNDLLQKVFDRSLLPNEQASLIEQQNQESDEQDSQISAKSQKSEKSFEKPQQSTSHKIQNVNQKLSNDLLSPGYSLGNLNLGPKAFSKQFEEESIKNISHQLKYLSPICVTYTPQNSGTPLYRTPSPSMPFFMSANPKSDFAQSFSLFKMALSRNQDKIINPEQ